MPDGRKQTMALQPQGAIRDRVASRTRGIDTIQVRGNTFSWHGVFWSCTGLPTAPARLYTVPMKSPDINRHIRSLQETATVARLNFEIWWVYKSEDTRPKYVGSMNRYLGFFQASIHAHFVAIVIALYRLYEKRSNTINLDRLLKALPAETRGKLPPDCNGRIARATDIWKKVSIVRNNCFGHLNGEASVSQSFERASLTPNEMRELMDLTEGILNDLTQVWNGSVLDYDLNARDDTVQLLDDLNGLTPSPRPPSSDAHKP